MSNSILTLKICLYIIYMVTIILNKGIFMDKSGSNIDSIINVYTDVIKDLDNYTNTYSHLKMIKFLIRVYQEFIRYEKSLRMKV